MIGANCIAICLNCDTWNLARNFDKLPMYVNIFLELFLSMFPRHSVHHTQIGDITNGNTFTDLSSWMVGQGKTNSERWQS